VESGGQMMGLQEETMKINAYSTSGTSPTERVDSADAAVVCSKNPHHGDFPIETGAQQGAPVHQNHKNHFNTSGFSPTEAKPDFLVENHLTLFLFFACADSTKTWLSENCPSDHLAFGQGIVIDGRCFWQILQRIQEARLVAVPR
jgi:hypothetical protein